MLGFIDRIEAGIAVVLLDGGGRAYLPASALPPGAAAGGFVDLSLAAADPPPGAGSAEEVAALIERLRAGEHRQAGHRHG